MSMYHQNPHHIQSHQSSKYIDPEKIYPKRLGTYQNGNALVLEYYNLATDKFKKHLIPLDHSKSAKENLEIIYKNPKHGLLLRKVEPKYVQNVLKGESVIGPSIIASQKHSFSEPFSITHPTPSSNSASSYSRMPSQSITNQPSYSHPEQSSYLSDHTSSLVNKQNYNQENSVSFIESKPSNGLSQYAKEKIEQVEDYYEEEFQDFEVSQSMGKKYPAINAPGKKQTFVDLSINSNPVNQSISIPLQSKYDPVDQNRQKDEKKQKKSKKSKDGKKAKKKKQQLSQDQFEFDFLDGDGGQKKSSKPKKDSKDKVKNKQKSIQKDKNAKKDKTEDKRKTVKETVVEDDFDFDL